MCTIRPRSLAVYAVVPADEAQALGSRRRGVRVVAHGPLAAVAGDVPPGREVLSQRRPRQEVARDATRRRLRAAGRHHRVVLAALDACSSVVPFRHGVDLPTEADVRAVLEINAALLAEHVDRFRGRVEMGLRARIAGPDGHVDAGGGGPERLSDRALRLLFGLGRVRALAAGAAARREQTLPGVRRTDFVGCYLILRDDVDRFWAVLDEIRLLIPRLPLLGSGPWAPYSFCDFVLRLPAGDRKACWQGAGAGPGRGPRLEA